MDWSKLVGIPFLDKGRTKDGCDCWGLVVLAYEAIGVALPSLAADYMGRADHDHIAGLIAGGKRMWSEVRSGVETEFDVVLMVIAGTQHLGVVVRRGQMLHMPRDSYSVIEPYTTARYASAVRRGGLYRHRPEIA